MKPTCKLVGTDGNVFALAGRVGRTLKDHGLRDEAKEFQRRLWSDCHSYADALCLMAEYVEITGDDEEEELEFDDDEE